MKQNATRMSIMLDTMLEDDGVTLKSYDSSKSLGKKFYIVKNYVKKNKSIILDIGTESENTFEIAKNVTRCKKIYGVNIEEGFEHYSDSELENMKNFKFYNGYSIPFKDKMFDVITIFYVLHHIKKPILKKLIKDIDRVLKKDGYVVIVDHNVHTKEIKKIVEKEHKLFSPSGDYYMKLMTMDEIRELFPDSYEICEQSYNSSIYNYHAKFHMVLQKK